VWLKIGYVLCTEVYTGKGQQDKSATVQKRGPQCFANQHECRCCRGFRKRRQCMTHYVPTIPVQPKEALYTQSRYTSTMHFAVFTQWLYTRTIKFELYIQSEYTPTMQSALSSRFLPLVCSAVLILFLFTHKKNCAKRHSRHISVWRVIADVPKRTEVVIRTSDAHGRRCFEQIFPDVSFL
jgi:hypothetical protein